MLSKPSTPNKPSTPSLRSPHPLNTQPTGPKPSSRQAPNTLTTTEALNLSIAADEKSPTVAKLTPLSKTSSSSKKSSKKLQMNNPHPQMPWPPQFNYGPPAFPGVPSQGYPQAPQQPYQQPYLPNYPPHHGYQQADYQQPLATVMPRPQVPLQQSPPPTCQCQCGHSVYPQPGYGAVSTAPVPPTNPLSIITDNVQRLLSPRATTQSQPVPTNSQSNPAKFEQVRSENELDTGLAIYLILK